jgi:hypothetical protein
MIVWEPFFDDYLLSMGALYRRTKRWGTERGREGSGRVGKRSLEPYACLP